MNEHVGNNGVTSSSGTQSQNDMLHWAQTLGVEAANAVTKPLLAANAAQGDIQVVDLFCGAGGMSTGFEAVGRLVPSFKLVAAVDIDRHSVATYGRNLPIEPIIADLSGLAEDADALGKLIEKLGIDPNKPLVVIGGPPCQGFSAHRKKSRAAEDDRNLLIESFTALVLALSPDYVAFENVPEVTAKKYWRHFEKMCEAFEEAGYSIGFDIHNLAGFGVPQERFRAIMLASKKSVHLPKGYLHHSEYLTVRDAIGFLPEVEPGVAHPSDPMHVSSKHRESTLETLRQVPANGGSRPKGVGPRCLQIVDGFRDVYGRLAWDKPANTITGFARNPASGRFVHPDQHRGLTIREAALLQGFPSNYAFEGPFGERYSQIGNAVPPKFAAYLAAHILGELWKESEVDEATAIDWRRAPASNSFSSGIAGRKKAK